MGRKLIRRIGVVAAALLVMVLAACDTQPATNVAFQNATLNAKGACTAGTSGQWWYQLRNVTRGTGFYDVGPRRSYSCGQNSGEVPFESQYVGGLEPGHLYQFRLAATVNGSFMWFDANGAQNGGNYDSFRTRSFVGGADQSPDPGEVSVPCTPDSPDDACSSSNDIRRKRNPLRNRLLWVFCEGCWILHMDVSDHRSYIDWSYNLSTQNIRTIHLRTHETNCLTNVGSCKQTGLYWRLADCNRSGPDTCLFRSEGRVEVNFVVDGVGWNRQLISCLGTRIRWDGTHVRNAFEGQCSTTGAARARSGHSADVSDQDLKIGDVPVGRYLNRAEMKALDAACMSRTADKRECERVARDLYRSLPDTVRAEVEASRGS